MTQWSQLELHTTRAVICGFETPSFLISGLPLGNMVSFHGPQNCDSDEFLISHSYHLCMSDSYGLASSVGCRLCGKKKNVSDH